MYSIIEIVYKFGGETQYHYVTDWHRAMEFQKNHHDGQFVTARVVEAMSVISRLQETVDGLREELKHKKGGH